MTARPNRCATCNPTVGLEVVRPGVRAHPNAFCGECWEPRFVAGGRPERMVKCANCGTRTKHYVTGQRREADTYDYGTPAWWHPDYPETQHPFRTSGGER